MKMNKQGHIYVVVLLAILLAVDLTQGLEAVVCERDPPRTLTCPQAGTVLQLQYINYGRTSETVCPGTLPPEHPLLRDTNCVSGASVDTIVKGWCEGQKSCSLQATNSLLGDTCRGTFKYLQVTYNCVPGQEAVVCERASPRTLTCPQAGSVLQLLHINYGRTSSTVCPGTLSPGHPLLTNTNCISGASVDTIVNGWCKGRQSCSLQATNSVFGDPCRGTFKYLQVTYNCVQLVNFRNS